jgi:anti-sigma factor RsiW
MISCDECQQKMVAVLDSEGNEADEELISVHLKSCPECGVFYEDMIRIRQEFVSVAVPSPPAATGQEIMQKVEPDQQGNKKVRAARGVSLKSIWLRFPRLAWASRVAALFLIVASWLVSVVLARKVVDLRHELQVAQQEMAVAQAESQLRDAQERQQKAISALYFRMAELEERIDGSASPRTAFFPTELDGLSDRPGQM